MKKREISPEQFIELERFAVAVENKTAFERKARVQNPRQYLSPMEESEFLHSLESEAEAGVLIGAKVVQGRLTERLTRH